jgi:hypothetical protein
MLLCDVVLYNRGIRFSSGGYVVITHFQFKPLFENKDMPGWHFSFYFKKQKFTGIYHPNGDIEWTSTQPPHESADDMKAQIHELMLFHVYDK